MKYFPTIIALTASLNQGCPHHLACENDKSVAKYSYIVYKNTRKYAYTATGFSIKKNDRYYFISAKHVFTGNDITGQKDLDYPDSINVMLCKSSNGEDSIMLNIMEIKNGRATAIWDAPDFYIYEIRRTKLPVNTIESLIDDNSTRSLSFSDTLIMYGYPYNYWDSNQHIRSTIPLVSTNTLRFPMENNLTWDKTIIDSFDYIVEPTQSSNFGNGYSGAPVFLSTKDHISFVGICSGGSYKMKGFIIVKAKYLADSVEKLK